ncbi:MAG: glycosyltransferase family 39 protein [Cytophagales bacterium]|nr:glycosyltransferase family 39 protein [Cytophagales bacterium]
MNKLFLAEINLKKVILFHLTISALRLLYLTLGPTDLFLEEAQYWLWSTELDWSYYSKPPFVAYLNFISTSIFDHTELAIKFNAVVMGLIFTLFVYLIAKEFFKDNREAFWTSLLVYAMPFFHTTFNFFLTDAPLLTAWAGAVYFYLKAIVSNHTKHWILLGVCCGVGLLSKYTMVLFAPVVLIHMLWFHRGYLSQKGPYITLLVAAFFLLPVLIWNLQMDFISFRHVASIGKSELTFAKRLTFVSEYWGGQIAIVSPFLFPFLAIAIYRALRSKDSSQAFLALGPILVFLFFLIYSFTKRVEVNWAVFAYCSVPILVVQQFGQMKNSKLGWHLATLTFSLLLVFSYLTPYLHPLGLHKIWPPKKDPVHRVVGWDKLGQRLQEIIDEQVSDPYFLFSDSYEVACQAAFYTSDHLRPYNINLGRRQNQLDLWPGLESIENQGYTGVWVKKGEGLPQEVKEGFKKVVHQETLDIELGGIVVKTFTIAVLEDLQHIEEQESNYY